LQEVANKLSAILKVAMDNSLESYSKKMQSIDITGSGWDQNIELSLKEHQIQLKTLVE